MASATKVREIEFSDLYLGHPSLADRFADVPGATVNPMPAMPELQEDLGCLSALCHEALRIEPSQTEFKISHDQADYRASVMHTLGGTVFVLRRITPVAQSLAALGIPQAYVRYLMSRELSGLFVVSGPIKSGKTTTACAMVRDRLTAYGGVAVTGENPIELPLEGMHGQGVCFQTALPHSRSEFPKAFRQLSRWGARTLLIDEVRDADTAVELLQASTNGHLIITTMMAENVIQTLSKLHALANEKLVNGGAQALLAEGVLGVLHQRILRGAKAKLETEFLFLRDAPSIRSVLRNGKYDALGSDMRQQMASMISESATANRFASG